MEIRKYQVDAFSNQIFRGNPAVVCPVDEFPDTLLMQQIAAEHNLSETAFIVKSADRYIIRWFTPAAEVELCGHATLASAFVIFEILKHKEDIIHFETLHRGIISVERVKDKLILDFPSEAAKSSAINRTSIQSCLNVRIVDHFDGRTDCLVLLENESAVQNAKFDLQKLAEIDRRGFIITAKSEKYDFVSRFFAPRFGVNEDPVTGSAHTLLIPFWSERLNKKELVAKQISRRGGMLYCTFAGERVKIGGSAVLYSEGTIYI